jgi:hypothetical protein
MRHVTPFSKGRWLHTRPGRMLDPITLPLERRCGNCDRTLSGRVDKRFCSDRCRVTAHRARRTAPAVEPQALPPELEQALARATEETRLLARVAAHAHAGKPTSWRAAAWILERRYPERWGRQPRAPDKAKATAECGRLGGGARRLTARYRHLPRRYVSPDQR